MLLKCIFAPYEQFLKNITKSMILYLNKNNILWVFQEALATLERRSTLSQRYYFVCIVLLTRWTNNRLCSLGDCLYKIKCLQCTQCIEKCTAHKCSSTSPFRRHHSNAVYVDNDAHLSFQIYIYISDKILISLAGRRLKNILQSSTSWISNSNLSARMRYTFHIHLSFIGIGYIWISIHQKNN